MDPYWLLSMSFRFGLQLHHHENKKFRNSRGSYLKRIRHWLGLTKTKSQNGEWTNIKLTNLSNFSDKFQQNLNIVLKNFAYEDKLWKAQRTDCKSIMEKEDLDSPMHEHMLMIGTVSPIDTILILFISVCTALLSEGLTYLLVYRTQHYKKLKAEVGLLYWWTFTIKEVFHQGLNIFLV